ncbi:AAA domain-containing protein [Scopulibacillus darangshiensis]|uniref:AAA domain-containing protein n=1 Tax=Scopulibacillus darangshiensis TaxID=442528 RepID=A0A4R2PB08_9BACL|nr:AAA family ATPase [Scopulibacillus darangshiensis]TCP32157.1 AAA domain-containing protein [Scopulibacillus darangshiensis]
MAFQVQRARREKMKAVVGFIGCSGSGKTAGALLTAYGMMKEAHPHIDDDEIWAKIGVVDTEHGRAKLYADLKFDDTLIGQFLHVDFDPPYSTARYNEAVIALKGAGCEVIIVDSLSHNWQGEGGIVETHGQMAGNSFQNWGKLAPETTQLIKTLTRNDVHILTTLRTKQEYVVESNSDGKMAPRKVGTRPVQKDEMEYEFMLNFNIGIDHVAETSKDNTRMFEGEQIKITPEVGHKLYQWLEKGVDVKAEEAAERTSLINEIKDIALHSIEAQKKVEEFEFKANMKLDDFNIRLANAALDRLQTFKSKEDK